MVKNFGVAKFSVDLRWNSFIGSGPEGRNIISGIKFEAPGFSILIESRKIQKYLFKKSRGEKELYHNFYKYLGDFLTPLHVKTINEL